MSFSNFYGSPMAGDASYGPCEHKYVVIARSCDRDKEEMVFCTECQNITVMVDGKEVDRRIRDIVVANPSPHGAFMDADGKLVETGFPAKPVEHTEPEQPKAQTWRDRPAML